MSDCGKEAPSSILDELNDALLDVLQEQWDRNLIMCWKKYPFQSMNKVVWYFMTKTNIDKQTFYKLKRIPKNKIHYTTRVSRYVAAYLPTLNNHLWNNNKTDDELVEICSKLSSLMYPSDQKKSVQERGAFRRAEQAYQKVITERVEGAKNRSKYGRRNWGAAKP